MNTAPPCYWQQAINSSPPVGNKPAARLCFMATRCCLRAGSTSPPSITKTTLWPCTPSHHAVNTHRSQCTLHGAPTTLPCTSPPCIIQQQFHLSRQHTTSFEIHSATCRCLLFKLGAANTSASEQPFIMWGGGHCLCMNQTKGWQQAGQVPQKLQVMMEHLVCKSNLACHATGGDVQRKETWNTACSQSWGQLALR